MFFCVVANAANTDFKDPGQKKLEIMKKLEAKSSDGIISFTTEEYKELVLENPRPYDVYTMFTVRSGCDGCELVMSEFKGAAYSYRQDADKLESPAFFGVLYYNSDPKVREIYTTHNFKTVPYLAVSKQVQKREDNDFYKSEDIWLVKANEAAEVQ